MFKRWLFFIVLQCILVTIVLCIAYSHKDKVALVKLPPASLEAWYKPENKRQVWLHNMFKLRREMQAVEYYSGVGSEPLLDKWFDNLKLHYLKIGEMVPEWKGKLDKGVIKSLAHAVEMRDERAINRELINLKQNCHSCHEDFRVIVATRYRAPDFSQAVFSNENKFVDLMAQLNFDVNSIKIASTDGRREDALASFGALRKGLEELDLACVSCHDKSPKSLLTKGIKTILNELEGALISGTVKDQGMVLGSLAVQACANCHANHRLNYEARELFKNGRPFIDLIQH